MKGFVVIIISLIGSIILPVLIILLFHVIFPDFYTKGFLTGIGHVIIGGIMMVLNVIIGPNLIVLYYEDMMKSKESTVSFYRAILIFILVSVVVQITLSILIENPFTEPTSGMFL
ncbi:hypothetical protein [Paenibacillus sp. GCM10012306]|uniref:hypothetical protein n=1 Tax=Paenibacillus sp. GCM10012306 TaxID=3317342 RepID=UPI00360A74AC